MFNPHTHLAGRSGKRVGLLLWVAVFCAGCGYHLRTASEIPESLKKVYVSGASSNLAKEIGEMIRAAKGKVLPTSKDAGIVITVLKEALSTRVLSIGTTGKSSELEIDYYLRYQLFDKNDKPLEDEQTIELARPFFNDQTAVLAKTSEQQLITKEMYKSVARMLMFRAQLAVENAQKKVAKK